MFTDILQPTHLIFVLVVALLVLGPKRLPEVGRSLGRGLRDFRSAMGGEDHDDLPAETPPMNLATAEPAHQPAPARPAEPAAEHTEPVAEHAEFVAEPTEPVAEHAEFVAEHTEPVADAAPAAAHPAPVAHQAAPAAAQPAPATTATAEQPEHVA